MVKSLKKTKWENTDIGFDIKTSTLKMWECDSNI